MKKTFVRFVSFTAVCFKVIGAKSPVLAILISGCLLLTGCNQSPGLKKYPLSGTVTFEEKLIEQGSILFFPKIPQHHAEGARIENGASITAQPGEYTARITASRVIPGKFEKDEEGQEIPVREQYLPVKYNEKSELTVVVEPDKSNRADFDLK